MLGPMVPEQKVFACYQKSFARLLLRYYINTTAETNRSNRPESNMTKTEQRKQALRHSIMTVMQANNVPVTGDFWFALVFRTESELKQIARELHIKA